MIGFEIHIAQRKLNNCFFTLVSGLLGCNCLSCGTAHVATVKGLLSAKSGLGFKLLELKRGSFSQSVSRVST